MKHKGQYAVDTIIYKPSHHHGLISTQCTVQSVHATKKKTAKCGRIYRYMASISRNSLTELEKVRSRTFHCCNKNYHEVMIFTIYRTYEQGEPYFWVSNVVDITIMKFNYNGKIFYYIKQCYIKPPPLNKENQAKTLLI